MPKGAQKGNGNARTHGIYSLRDHGLEALSENERELAFDIVEELKTAQGISDAIRYQASVNIILCRMIENWVQSEVASGVPMEEISLLKAYPAFSNSALRSLKAAGENIPTDDAPKNVTELLEQFGSED